MKIISTDLSGEWCYDPKLTHITHLLSFASSYTDIFAISVTFNVI